MYRFETKSFLKKDEYLEESIDRFLNEVDGVKVGSRFLGELNIECVGYVEAGDKIVVTRKVWDSRDKK